MSCNVDDDVIFNLLYKHEFNSLGEKLIQDLLNQAFTFSERLECFRSRAQDLLYYAIDCESEIPSIAKLFDLVQRELSPERPLDLPAECVALYIGPENIQDPLFVASIVTDLLWILEQELNFNQGEERALGRRKNLIELSKQMINDFIHPILIRERMELEFQYELGVISDVKSSLRREVRARTSLLYVQTKFNLFREESEGFSKLVIEVFQALEQLSAIPPSDYRKEMQEKIAQQLVSRVVSLIGYFSIDPNRVLDVILDLFAANITDNWELFLLFLELSPWRSKAVSDNNGKTHCPLLNEVLVTKFVGHDPKTAPKNIPENMYLVAAILVKHKLADLDYLFNRLSPPNCSFKALADEYYGNVRKKENRPGRFQSQSLTGQLSDQGIQLNAGITSAQALGPFRGAESTKIEGLPCSSNQKVLFTKCALAIGDVKTAFYIMGRIPQIPEIYADIPELVCRLLYEIVDVHDDSPLAAKRPEQLDNYKDTINTTSIRDAHLSARTVRTRRSNYPKYKYFYPHWKSDLPVIDDSLEFVVRCRVYLSSVKANLHRDPVLLGKLIRVGTKHVAEAKRRLDGIPWPDSLQSQTPEEDKFYSVNHEQVLNSWLSLVFANIFPAISRADPNPANSYGLWKIIREYPSNTRYALYGEWEHRVYADYPEVSVERSICSNDCRYIMIRLSKDIIKQSGRQIAKVVHSNPVIAFTYIIRQIKSYDNMIPHVVDATRYLADLEFDILAYCIIEALACEKSPRFQGNDITIAPWLKYLASFTGRLFRKHPIDLSGLLIYTMSQLLKGNAYELTVLRELVSFMSGVKPIEDITDAQIDGLSGGEVLKRESLFYENTKAVRKSSSRLTRALIDADLVSKFPIIIAQMRQKLTSHDPGDEYERNLKTVVWLADHCGGTLLQYVEFLSLGLSPEAYGAAFPSLESLINDYSLSPEYAFTTLRPYLSYKLNRPLPFSMNVDSKDEPQNQERANNETMRECVDCVIKIFPKSTWAGISPEFYVEFWQLSGKNIFNPVAQYVAEIKAQQKAKKVLELELPASGVNGIKLQKRIEKINTMIKCLETEQISQETLCKNTIQRIEKESKFWLEKSEGNNEIINTMIQYCIYPRCIMSPIDAVYTARFILLMHSLGVPNVATISLYDRLLTGDVFHAIIFSSTEDEAKNYGTFLAHVFETLSSWRKCPELFEKEAIGVGMPGFLKKWPSKPPRGASIDLSTAEFVLHTEFKQAMRKWHLKMFRAIVLCLRSGEYMRVRNSVLVLDKIGEHFPITKEMGKHLEMCIQELEKTETREDLKQLTRSYYTKMQIRKQMWVNTGDFCPPAVQTSSNKKSHRSPVLKKEANSDQKEQISAEEQPPSTLDIRNITHSSSKDKVCVLREQKQAPREGEATVPASEPHGSHTLQKKGALRPPEEPHCASRVEENKGSSIRADHTELSDTGVEAQQQTTVEEQKKGVNNVPPQKSHEDDSCSKHHQKSSSDTRQGKHPADPAPKTKSHSHESSEKIKSDVDKYPKNSSRDNKSRHPSDRRGGIPLQAHCNSSKHSSDIHRVSQSGGTIGVSEEHMSKHGAAPESFYTKCGGPVRGSHYRPDSTTPVGASASPRAYNAQLPIETNTPSGGTALEMETFLMRPHNTQSFWSRMGDSQRLYGSKTSSFYRSGSSGGHRQKSSSISSSQQKDSESSSSRKRPDDYFRGDSSSRQCSRSHDHEKKRSRSPERFKYGRKRKDRDSEAEGGSEKTAKEQKQAKKHPKDYPSQDEGGRISEWRDPKMRKDGSGYQRERLGAIDFDDGNGYSEFSSRLGGHYGGTSPQKSSQYSSVGSQLRKK